MKIIHGQVFDLERGFFPRELDTDGALVAENSTDDQLLDAAGCYVIPALVDVHFHGCVGEDCSDASLEGLRRMADYELSQGVGYLCPATMTLLEEQLRRICQTAAAYRAGQNQGAELVGLHLEGPFLSHAKKGAQNEAFLRAPDGALLQRLQQAADGCIRLVTVAPELPGALNFIETAGKLGVTVSLGHTQADYDTAAAAFSAGAAHVTHLFNAMPPFHHRVPGIIGAAFDAPEVMVELVCDGVHLHGSVVRAVFRMFGAERVILVSDSLRAAGMPDGQYPFGGQQIEVHGNRATLLNQPETLAGSVTSLMGCLRQAVAFGIPLKDAVRAAAYNPAQSIGIHHRVGSLEVGKEASLILLDEKNLSIRDIVFRGRRVK